jgi:amidase
MDTTTGTALWGLGASELARTIRERRASSLEVVDAHLERIEAVNQKVNAITEVLAERARHAANEADRRLAAGERIGPLHGVPFTVKENIDLAGTPTTWGVVALKEAIPPIDAPQVANILDAGAIPIGRTNLPDLALRWHSDNALHGAVRNPWDPSRTAGGSSGGEGAALATGMTPLGLGNDLGGSLRWPAQCNAICSIKPTLGRIPQATVIEPVDSPISIQLMSVQGPMARHVADLRLGLEVMSRPSGRDACTPQHL